MGQVDDLEHSPRQRQPDRHERVQAAHERAGDGGLEVDHGRPSRMRCAALRCGHRRAQVWARSVCGPWMRRPRHVSSGQTMTQSPSWICLIPWVGRPEVVGRRIERQVAVEGRVRAALVEGVADRLLVEAAGSFDARDEDLPRRPRARWPGSRRWCRAGPASVARDRTPRRSRGPRRPSPRGWARWARTSRPQMPRSRLAQPQERAWRGEQAEHQRRPIAELLHGLDQRGRLDAEPVGTMSVGIDVAQLLCDRGPFGGAGRVRDVGQRPRARAPRRWCPPGSPRRPADRA